MAVVDALQVLRSSSKELMSMVGLREDIVTLVRRSRLQWYEHVLRRNKEVGIRRALEFETQGVTGRGRPQLGWRTSGKRQSESMFTGC